ncbi:MULTISPECIES: helix-turn-helix transcriptional regulator [Moorena]|uniref:XRE family transcriptional regulator n=2 Tax=Moorena TaxID=1155738 RepID=A0A1U7MZE4_9CYAN|nr:MULTISPECIES: helix-turn-helix transcriptional regulator [Moorena]NEO24686.1 XRE family transcriptional regulator [Moorena sp. SIO4A5]NEO75247.1 XRE family transcriptional regulator [Moorena sp. SIO4G3]OLT59024.1 XRE family transcriptional regulator [Moorena bouillonii PNG]
MTEEKTVNVLLGDDNVFKDLGFEAEEAMNLKVRADLMLDLRSYIQERGWTQNEAAEFLGETQPRISNLMNGEISRFSVDKLINLLGKVGMEVKVEVVPKVL